MARFLDDFGNADFRRSHLTWVSLAILLVFYPAMQMLSAGDTTADLLKNMSAGLLKFTLIVTILFQWGIFLVNYASVYLEGTGLKGVGLKRIRGVDFAWAFSFLLAANLILAGVTWFLGQIGLPMPGEIGLLVPTDPFGKVIWVAVSFTAGFCEEVAFRGYLMTRLRLLGRFNSWVIPVIVSAATFGICHAYQGLPGFIVITLYGLMFSALYLWTGRLWPCIIAHFFQDFMALIIPQ